MSLREYAQQTQQAQQTQKEQKAQYNIIDLKSDNDRLKRQQAALNRYSAEVKTELLKSVEAGKDTTEMLLIACKGIADITGENLFYTGMFNKLKEAGLIAGK